MQNINRIQSKVLANLVVAYRCFGSNRDLAIEAMKELSSRRDTGDPFEYEKFIDEESSKIKIILNESGKTDLKNLLNTILSMVK